MTTSGGTTWRVRAAYAGRMTLSSRAGRAARHARPAARQAGRGLLQVLVGADPPPAWRSPWQRRAVHVGLGVATLVLCVLSLLSLTGVSSYLFQQANISIVGSRPSQVAAHRAVAPLTRFFIRAPW